MTKLILTRFLYIYDEVCISLLTSLLKKQSLDECYFWTSELYLSGLEKQCWEFIWFVYYDFYYIDNPYFGDYISKKYSKYDFKSVITVIKNMFKLKSSPHIFITRQYNINIKDITHIFRGKKPSWLTKYPTKYHGLLRFIDKKIYHSAVSSLPEIITDELFEVLKTYFNIPDDEFISITMCIQSNDYDNSYHKLWSVICLFIFNPSFYTSKKKLQCACSESEYNTLLKHHSDPIPLSPKYNHSQVYKTLEYKRKYHIHSLCSSFTLLRDASKDIDTDISHHWEYHAYSTPIWLERFNKYKTIVDCENKRIEFMDDEELEAFYSLYGYDPDEQSKETQNKGLLLYENNNWKKWYDNVFQESSLFKFDDDFKFSY